MKIINHRLSSTLLYFFSLIFCLIAGFLIGRMSNIVANVGEMKILQKSEFTSFSLASSTIENENNRDSSVIFGSSKGKYYYYKGCGGETISPKNLVYYKSEAEAKGRGKTLYSKCQ